MYVARKLISEHLRVTRKNYQNRLHATVEVLRRDAYDVFRWAPAWVSNSGSNFQIHGVDAVTEQAGSLEMRGAA